MFRVFRFLVVTCLSFIVVIHQSLAEEVPNLEIKGLAVQEKFREPIFYAATFAKDSSSSTDFQNMLEPFRMEARFIVDQYSARQNHQLWVGAIIINNSREKLKPLAKPMMAFSKMMKMPMIKGDRLSFDYQPNVGTQIILNGIKIGTIEQNEFQSVLLATWFGKRPPSKSFAEKIRSTPSNETLREFHTLRAAPERIAQLKVAYGTNTRPSAPVNNVARPAQKKAAAEFTGRSKAPKIASSSVTQKQKSVDSSKKTNASKAKVVSKPKIAQTKPPKTPQAKPRQTLPKKEETKAAKVAKIEKPKAEKILESKVKADDNQTLDVVDQMISLLTQDYLQEVKSYIEQKAQPVPPIRVRKKPKTNALVLITFKRDGGSVKVADTKFIQGGYDPALQKVVSESVKRLKNIPPMPESINADQLSVEVELGFERCKRSMSAWVCF